ncbi:hypothetical protein V9T40_013198 [Parthenolecanium corni]|uniref:Uncharacterized protein n=1 Tax=Parthenolecanium corni TaxID=536013 RepID=A0AAN9TKX7_9HEMI
MNNATGNDWAEWNDSRTKPVWVGVVSVSNTEYRKPSNYPQIRSAMTQSHRRFARPQNFQENNRPVRRMNVDGVKRDSRRKFPTFEVGCVPIYTLYKSITLPPIDVHDSLQACDAIAICSKGYGRPATTIPSIHIYSNFYRCPRAAIDLVDE